MKKSFIVTQLTEGKKIYLNTSNQHEKSESNFESSQLNQKYFDNNSEELIGLKNERIGCIPIALLVIPWGIISVSIPYLGIVISCLVFIVSSKNLLKDFKSTSPNYMEWAGTLFLLIVSAYLGSMSLDLIRNPINLPSTY